MGKITTGRVRVVNWKKKIILVLIFTIVLITFMSQGLFWPNASFAVTRVGSGGAGGGSATSYNITIPSTTAGNTLIAVVGAIRNTNHVSSITGGGTWVRAASAVNTNTQVTEVWYCPNISAGVTTVTVNTSAAVDTSIVIQEYSGVLTTSPLDKTATATGNGTSQNSGTTTATAQANELWVAGFSTGVTGTYSGQSAGWTIVRSNAAVVQTALVENLTNSASAANCTITGPNGQWGGVVATFLPCTGTTQTLDSFTDNSANTGVPVSNFTMATIASTGACSGASLTSTRVSVGGTVAAADVASIRVLWGAAQVGIVNNPSSLTNIDIALSGAGLGTNNLVYQISLNASAAGKTFNLTVTSVTGATADNIPLPKTTATRNATAGGGPAQVPAGNIILFAAVFSGILIYGSKKLKKGRNDPL